MHDSIAMKRILQEPTVRGKKRCIRVMASCCSLPSIQKASSCCCTCWDMSLMVSTCSRVQRRAAVSKTCSYTRTVCGMHMVDVSQVTCQQASHHCKALGKHAFNIKS